MPAWSENDAFWHEFQDAMFTAERWQTAAADVENATKRLELSPGAAVLDLACGPGRHALELARRGFDVTGVDRTDRYLEEARKRADGDRLHVEWVRADMREFRRCAAFDGAISLFTSFGFFDNPADDRRVLENLFASLKPGGRVVMEMLGKEVLARKFQPTGWSRLADGRLWLEERFILDNWARVESRWTLIDDTRRAEHVIRLRLYSASELQSLLLAVGFARVACYGALAGTPYDHNAERLVIVGQRGD